MNGPEDPKLSEVMRDRIDAELEPGETVVWAGAPVPRYLTAESKHYLLFAVPWLGISLTLLVQILRALFKDGEFHFAAVPFVIFILPFVGLGIGLLCTPFMARRKALGTGYAITDRRAISIETGRLTTVRSFSPQRLRKLRREDNGDGTGDVIVEYASPHLVGAGQANKVGFLQIQDPRDVERRLKALANAESPHASASTPVANAPEPGNVPQEFHTRIERELKPGERIVWIETPIRRFLARGGYKGAIAISIFATFLSLFVAMLGVSYCIEAGPTLSGALFFVPLTLLIGGALTHRLWSRPYNRNTVFAITDRRAIVSEKRREERVQSFRASALGDIVRKENQDGTGSLIFEFGPAAAGDANYFYDAKGFFQIRNPREVQRFLSRLPLSARQTETASGDE